jgi:hypothetical protein
MVEIHGPLLIELPHSIAAVFPSQNLIFTRRNFSRCHAILWETLSIFHHGSLPMRARTINRNKLHAVLCMTSSAVVSIVLIAKAIQWLF